MHVDVDVLRLDLERHWEEQGATRLELPPEEPPLARARDGDGAWLPGETLAPAEVPAAPAHWGTAAGDGDDGGALDAIYREDESDDELLLRADADAGGDGTGEDDDEEYYDYEYEYYDDDELEDYYYDEYYEPDDQGPPEAKLEAERLIAGRRTGRGG